MSKSVEYVDIESYNALINTEYQLDKFNDYKNQLYAKSIINNLKNGIYHILNSDDSDLEKIEQVEDEFFKIKEKIKSDKKHLSFSDLISEHKKTIEKRSKGIRITTGDFNFDKLVPSPTAGICTIVGSSGSMKSTFCHQLLKCRIAKRLPTTYFNTELSKSGVMDSLTASLIDEDYSDIMGLNNEDEHIDFDNIVLKYNELEEHYKEHKMFQMYPSNNVTIKKIKAFNKRARKEFGMKDDELLFCIIDLMSMVEEFCATNTSRADAITLAINELNNHALEDNVFIIGTIQARRNNNKIGIKKEEDLEKFRITLEMLKDSGEWEGRSRLVISIFNPKHIVMKNPCSEVIRELTEPLLELTVLKDTYIGKVGSKIKYLIDGNHKSLIPYIDENDETKGMSDSIKNDLI